MKFKHENDLNIVQSYFYKENDYSSSSTDSSLKDDLQYSNYYNEFNHHNLINTDNMPNNVSNLLNNQKSYCSSTNYMCLPKTTANNQFESNSSNLVTSTNYFTNLIPLPNEEANSSTFDNESLIRLRNLKERNRVRTVNDGFDRLRKHLPSSQFEFKKDKRLSKVQTLKLAITYIKQLENILNSN